ncbi:uncharacterized protein LOC113005544 [Solenopsis invicta]|uniref:uncharacterized protein LOC113005544 n=1 Tax=Solenopsis invicta TaxID=13686 RepID=UPI00193D1C28|nr:uncharacterized protein LOC113005544 [Solenopsis invicta]
MTTNDEKTICKIYKIKMKNLLTSSNEEISMDDNLKQPDDVHDEDSDNNKWSQWAEDIDNEVQQMISDNEGDRENAHYMPVFADRLLKDIKLIPMWSCICRDKFGYGRIPASSASVESDFNIIKNTFLKTEQTPMRVDEFITKHISFISGRIKLTDINFQDKEKNTEDVIEPINSINITIADNVNEDIETEGPACKNGDHPSSAHVCYICQKNVHALDACSASVGEEGYGQKRICKNCQRTDVQNIIASREEEDWRGLAATESQSKGRYLQEMSIENEFLLDKNIRKIPIIKNGGNLNIKAITFQKKKYSFTNTLLLIVFCNYLSLHISIKIKSKI